MTLDNYNMEVTVAPTSGGRCHQMTMKVPGPHQVLTMPANDYYYTRPNQVHLKPAQQLIQEVEALASSLTVWVPSSGPHDRAELTVLSFFWPTPTHIQLQPTQTKQCKKFQTVKTKNKNKNKNSSNNFNFFKMLLEAQGVWSNSFRKAVPIYNTIIIEVAWECQLYPYPTSYIMDG